MVTDLMVTAGKAATLNKRPGSKIITSRHGTNKPVSFLLECRFKNNTALLENHAGNRRPVDRKQGAIR